MLQIILFVLFGLTCWFCPYAFVLWLPVVLIGNFLDDREMDRWSSPSPR